MFVKLGKNLLRFSPLLFACLYQKRQNCFFWDILKRNSMSSRIYTQVQISNSPCEDRNDHYQLKSIEGYAAAVYDGHGGWQVSQLCNDHLLKKLDQILSRKKSIILDEEQLIKQSIRQAFLEIEAEFLSIARLGYPYGFGRMARAGSCALICVVANNKVYTGNAGDSLGILVSQKQGQMSFKELNRQLNADLPQEQQRLQAKFPKEEDIVVCKRENKTSCYVKGRLQPTRSIGDLRLKFAQFNNPKNYTKEQDFQPPLKVYTGPYITAQPEIKVFPLQKQDKFIVLASDGLWDKLGRQEVADLFKKKEAGKMPSLLIEKCLEKAATETKSTIEAIRKIPQGKKRKIHDDITVVVIDLKNQRK